MVRNKSLLDRPMRQARPWGSATCVTGSPGVSVVSSNSASAENSQPRNDAPQPRTRQTGRKIVDGRAFADLRQRRIRHDNAGKGANIEPLRDRQRPRRNQFASLCTDNRRADYLSIHLGYDFNMTMRFALGLRAIIVVIRPAQNTDLDAALACPGFA